MSSTALRGTPLELTFEKVLQPGTPRSRENAKHMRDALVRHAMPQNSCPIVEISTTALIAAGVSAESNTASELPRAVVHGVRRRRPRR